MAPISLGILAASGSGQSLNWILAYPSGSFTDRSHVFPVGTSPNLRMYDNLSAGTLFEVDEFGEILWARTTGMYGWALTNGIGMGDSPTTYWVVHNDSAVIRFAEMNYNAYSMSRQINTGYNFPYGFGITVVPSNIYVTGTDGNEPYAYIGKFDLSGSTSWQRTVRGSSTTRSTYFFESAIDQSTGDVFAGGYNESVYRGWIGKFNSSGSLQWMKEFRDPTNGDSTSYVEGLRLSSDNNLLMIVSNGQTNYLVKMDFSGSIIWQVKMLQNQSTQAPIEEDSSGNIWLLIQDSSGAQQKPTVMKFSSSGTVLLQRQIGVDGYSGGAFGFALNNDGLNYTVAFRSNDKSNYAKLPRDGSKTGTYVIDGDTFRYDIPSVSTAAGTLTTATPSTTVTNVNFSNSASYPALTTITPTTILKGI